MIVCPNCQHEELNGAVFCSLCGHELIEESQSTTQQTPVSSIMEGISPPTVPVPSLLSDEKDSKVILYLAETKEVICLKQEKDYTLGRIAEGQKVIPDIDLSEYNAYKTGVSRIHAMINTRGDQVTVKDLGSSNGSRLNGVKIESHAEYNIQHEDFLTLGALKIRVLLNKESGEQNHAD